MFVVLLNIVLVLEEVVIVAQVFGKVCLAVKYQAMDTSCFWNFQHSTAEFCRRGTIPFPLRDPLHKVVLVMFPLVVLHQENEVDLLWYCVTCGCFLVETSTMVDLTIVAVDI